MTSRRWCIGPIILLLASTSLLAQQPGADSTRGVGPTLKDSIATGTRAPLLADTAGSKASSPRKSPGTAMLLSALLPGAGQFYNQSYWKVPIVTGLAIYFVSEWLTNNRRYKDYRNQFSSYVAANPNSSLPETSNPLFVYREFYKDQRDSYTWYYVILFFVNLADAYVDASLFSFDVGGSLSLNRIPGPRLTLHFHF